MFSRIVKGKAWLIAMLATGLLVFAIGCSDDNDGDNGPSGPTADPDAPGLIEPNDGETINLTELAANDEDLILNWEDVDMAADYRLQIAVDEGFSQNTIIIDTYETGYFDYDLEEWVYDSQYHPQISKLIIGASHYWRVKTVWDDGTETAGWSEVYDFTPTVDPKSITGEILQGEITEDMTLAGDGTTHLLRGGVFVGYDDGTMPEVTLTIEAGAIIYGESASDGMLVIRRSGKIMAEGTAGAPIVFTSDKPEGSRGRGDWGGVIINGEAELNVPGGEAVGEGDTGPYGGGNNPYAADDSGVLRYVRIEFAGREISPDNELNGLALQGVGSGTTIEYVQVHMNQDDGIEFFGGTAQAKYIYVTGCADDQFDWTDGWQGKGQFWICQQYTDDADQGIEADNNGDNQSAAPYSNPMIYNMTLVGAKTEAGNDESDIGMLLREGTKASIRNAIVTWFGQAGVDVDGAVSEGHAASGELIVQNSVFYNNETLGADEPFDVEFITNEPSNYVDADPMLMDPYNVDMPDFMPQSDSFVLESDNAAMPPDDGFFEQIQFIGGMGSTNWLAGWTTSATN